MLNRLGHSDHAVLRQVLAGHRERFAELVTRYHAVVHSVALAHTGNHADAEDIAQETFLRAYQALGTLRKSDRVNSWLLSIARNKSRDFLRKRQRDSNLGETLKTQPAAEHPDPSDRELHELLWKQVNLLDETVREVLILHYFNGQTTRQIAGVLGISRDATQKRLQRGREALGRKLESVLRAEQAQPDTAQSQKAIMGAVATMALPKAEAAPHVHNRPGPGTRRAAAISMVTLAGIAAWWWFARGADPMESEELLLAQDAVGVTNDRADSNNETAQAVKRQGVFTSPPEPPAETAPPAGAGTISGRVYDATDGNALAGIPIIAVSESTRTRHGVMSDTRGEFRLPNLPADAYTVICKPEGGYTASKGTQLQARAGLHGANAEAYVEFSLVETGFLTGRILLNGEPLAETTMRLESEPALDAGQIVTDDRGEYRIETPADYDGALRGHLPLKNTVRATPYHRPRFVDSREQTLDFDFYWGDATVEGAAFFHSSEGMRPAELNRMVVTYLLLDDHSNNRLNMEATPNPDGTFRIEGLWPGKVNVGIYPENRNIWRHRTTFDLAEGETVHHEFHLHDTEVRANVHNVPGVTKSVWINAFEGEVPLDEHIDTMDLDFHAFLVEDQLATGSVSHGVGSIGGLPPGRYTIVAAGLPTYPHSLHYQAMGDDFFRLFRTTWTYVTIPEDEGFVSVELTFPREREQE